MTIDIIVVGKTDSGAVSSLVETYLGRVKRWVKCAVEVVPDVREKLPAKTLKEREGGAILARLKEGDFVVLLDDKGAEFTSVEFARRIEKHMNAGLKRLVFVIGGAYGFSPEVYSKADEKLSLSRMTFSHQIVRALFAEQLYRALAILRNEPYHHE